MVYCVVPEDLERLIESLSRFYAGEADVEVIVERRRGDRRRGSDRRRGGTSRADGDRRRIMNPNGRRIAERRAMAVPVAPLELPRRVARRADQLLFFERIELPAQQREDVDTGRLVTRFQAGETEVFKALYERYFDRVYTYLRMALKDRHEAEDAAQDVFINALQALPEYEIRAVPFRAWLFRLLRNHSLNLLSRQKRLLIERPEDVSRRQENGGGSVSSLPGRNGIGALDWISDQDLMVLIERLPATQRQALLLRYMFGFSAAEVAQVLGKSPEAVRQLNHRAIGFLNQRLTALGRTSGTSTVQPMVGMLQQATVLRSRRFALAR